MKRVWKPLDINGLRLYRVYLSFPKHPRWNLNYIVAAHSPSDAVRVIVKENECTDWVEEPIITGHALQVSQPVRWWEGEDE